MSETGQDQWSTDPGRRDPRSAAGSSDDPFPGSWDGSGAGQQAGQQTGQQAGQQAAAQSAQQAAWGRPAAQQQGQQASWGQQHAAQQGAQGYGQARPAAQPAQQAAWGQQAYGQQQAQAAQQAAWGQQAAAQPGYPAPQASGGMVKLTLDLDGAVGAPWAGFIALGGALLVVISTFLPWSVAGEGDYKTSVTGWQGMAESGFLLFQMPIFIPVALMLAGVGLITGITGGKKRLPFFGMAVSGYYLLAWIITLAQMLSDDAYKLSNVGAGLWFMFMAWITALVGFALAVLMKSTKTP
jgi:hypothetical protein